LLKSLPINLITLICNNNNIYRLPDLHEKIKELDCRNNYILEIPQKVYINIKSSGQKDIYERVAERVSKFDTCIKEEEVINQLIEEYKGHGYEVETILKGLRRKRTY